MNTMDIGKNDVKDISVLKDMKNLECLGLAYNNISNLDPLKGLVNLSTVDLYDNVITDNYNL